MNLQQLQELGLSLGPNNVSSNRHMSFDLNEEDLTAPTGDTQKQLNIQKVFEKTERVVHKPGVRQNQLNAISGTSARVNFFDRSLGGNALAIFRNGIFYWPDGSNREGNPLGALAYGEDYESDTLNPNEKLRNMKFYAQERLEEFVLMFTKLKRRLEDEAEAASFSESIAPNQIESVKKLKRLKRGCKYWSAEFDRIELLLNPPKANQRPMTKAEFEQRETNRKNASAYAKQLKQIEV